MPLFACDNCDSVVNTVDGTYWIRSSGLMPVKYEGKALCYNCAPETFKNGEPFNRMINKRQSKKDYKEVYKMTKAEAIEYGDRFIYLGRFEKYRKRK